MGFEDYVDEPVMIDGMYRSTTGMNYSNPFFYEKKFFNEYYVETKKDWMRNNWHLSIVYAVVYVSAVFGGQWYMKSREKFDLRRSLVAWNFVLAAFSIFGTIRMLPEFYHTLTARGFEHSFCSCDYTHGVSGCWSWLFILSKVPELVDTVFIVLRKQQLIFLHWYHHATVLIYCWYSAKDFTASGRWFVFMNYTVHAFMYTYYGFRALRFKIPKWVNIAITSGQISQMVFGIMINYLAYQKKKRGEPCSVSDENIQWSFFMYFTYFLLFFHFFYNAYLASPKKRDGVKNGSANGHSKANGHINGNGHHIKSDINNNNNNNHTNGVDKKNE